MRPLFSLPVLRTLKNISNVNNVLSVWNLHGLDDTLPSEIFESYMSVVTSNVEVG